MSIEPLKILNVLDRCCDQFTFPMLDNGYVYLAATRLSLFRSDADWALVIETFGFSPRAEVPDTCIYTFANTVCNRNVPESYGKGEVYEAYLRNNPNNEMRFIYSLDWDAWQEVPDSEEISESAKEFVLRGRKRAIPLPGEYAQRGIALEKSPRVQVFEFCRLLAAIERDAVLATEEERRLSVLPNMRQILQLEEWHHPNVGDPNERPSGSETFQQLARVLATGDVGLYRPSLAPNTHWSNWPDGGTL